MVYMMYNFWQNMLGVQSDKGTSKEHSPSHPNLIHPIWLSRLCLLKALIKWSFAFRVWGEKKGGWWGRRGVVIEDWSARLLRKKWRNNLRKKRRSTPVRGQALKKWNCKPSSNHVTRYVNSVCGLCSVEQWRRTASWCDIKMGSI